MSRLVISGLVWTGAAATFRNIEQIRGGDADNTGRSVEEGQFGGTGDV